MPAFRKGELWIADFGLAAKVRPALLLTDAPTDDELAVITVILHTTSTRGNRWEVEIPKPFLKEGAFQLQYIQTISIAKLERRLGFLTGNELSSLERRLFERLKLV